MKKYYLSLLLLAGFFFVGIRSANSQCIPRSTSYWGEMVPNAGCGVFRAYSGFGPGQYFRMPILQGGSYSISTCGAPYDTQITGFQGTVTNSNIFYNDDNGPICSGLNASITYTPNFTDYVRVNVNLFNCQSGGASSVPAGGSASITVRVRQNNNLNFTSSSASMCAGETRTLTATPTPVGSGPTNSGNPGTFSGVGVSGTTFTAPTPSGASQNYTITYSFGYCTTTQTITVYRPPTTANAGPDQFICSSSTVLAANNPSSGTGSWSIVSGPGSVSSPSSPTSSVSGLVPGTSTVLRWSISNGSCPTSTDDVVISGSNVVASASSTPIACFGQSSTVTVSGSGGVPPYSGASTFIRPAGIHTFTVTDANGCSDDVTITINQPSQLVASATAAVIPCIGGTTDVTVSASGGTAPYAGDGIFNQSAGTYTYTVTDANGCTANATITVNENDNIPPTAVCQNLMIDLDATGNASITASDIDNGSSDACGIASLSISQSSFDCSDVGANTVTLTVVDNGGNSSTCSSTVTVNDNVAPNAICQDLIIDLDATGNASITANDIDNGSSDACGIASLSISQSSFDCSNVGANPVTLTVVDNNGNSSTCSATVTVNDNVTPSAICQNLVVELDANGNASISSANNALANSSSDFSASQGANGWTYGHYLAFDANNFIPLSFNGFVWNNPGVGQPLDFPQLDPNGGHPAQNNLYWAVRRWTSNFSGNINITGDFYDRDLNCGDGANVRVFKNGVQVYEYLNIPGSSVPYSIPLTVSSGDIIDFAIDPKFDFGCDDTHFTASITSAMGIDNGSSDACGVQNLSVSQSSFDCSDVGSNTVTLTVVDNNGNSSTCSAIVTVNDNVAPNAVCQDVVIDLDASGNASITASDIDGGSSDACGIASLTASQTAFDCSNVGANTVTLTVVDNNGNSSTCTATVTVNDNVAPVATCQDVVIDLDAAGNASITASDIDGGSSDACGIASLTASQTAFDCSNVGANTVTLTVVDNNGNSSTCTATVTVNDNVAPVATCQDVVIDLDAAGNASITASDIDGGSSDACGIASLTASQTAFDCSNVGANTVTLTVVDNNGNSSTCTATVTVNDNVAPVATCQDVVIDLDAAGNASITASDIDGGSSDACGIASLTASQTAFDCSNVGANTVTLTVVDNNGNSSTCTATVTVNDNVAPVATCQDVVIDLDAAGNASITASDIDGGSSDACGIASLTASQTAFDCSNVGANTVTLTVVDNNGNSSTCTATVTVNDNVAPVATCQDVVIDLDAAGNASITASDIDGGSSDACGIASLTASQTAFDCSNVGANTVTLTVVDNNGNSSTCTATVTVNDNVAPVATCQDVVIDLDAAGNASITASDIDGGSSDACGIASLTASQTAFDCSNVGANTVTLTVVDNNGNSSTCTATVTVNDNVAPVAICQDVVIDLDAAGNASITASDIDGGSSDACGIASLTASQTAFDCSNVGANTVTLTVVDNNGNSSTCTATVTVNDNVAPVATCQDVVIDLDAAGNASITASDIDGGSSDACGIASLTASQTAFDCSNVGANTVTLTVVDNNGNSSTCTATVTVNDNVAPVATCQDVVIDLDAAGNASITASDIDGGSSDACGIASLTASQTAFDCSNVGANTVTLTVVDNNGNSSTCTATVTVNDNVAPVATCQDVVIDLDAAGNASIAASDIDGGSSDACGIASLTASQTAFDCSNVGANTVTLTVVDNNGNSSTCTATVTVNDNVAPVATCQDVVIDLDAAGNASITASDIDGGSSDACGIASLTASQTAFDCSNVGANTVTLTVVDNNGNSSTCTATVTVNDNVAPVATCQDVVIDLDASGNASITASDIDGGSSDACGIASLTASQTAFDCSNVGANTVTLTVVDNNGNSSTCTATVTVNDNVAPVATCQDVVIDLDAAGNASITASDIDGGSSDACGIASLTASQTAFDCSNVGANTVTLTVVDNNGNSSTCTATVTVNDNVAPVATCQDVVIDLDAAGNASITASDIDGGSSDACGIASLAASQTAFDCSNVGANTVTLTVVDNNGNSSTCTATVTVNDNVAPVATCQDVVIDLDAAGNASITASDIDGGSSDACGIASLTASQTAFDCSNVGANTVTLTVVDNNGNSSTCTATVTVNDNVAPVATCQDVVIDLDASGNASITASDIDGGSSDACGIASLTASQTAFDCSNVGANTVTLTVVDVNGNSSTCTSTVTVNDNIAPTAICQDLTVTLDASGNASVTANDIDNGSFDNCGIASLSILSGTTSYTCDDVEQTFPVTLLVADVNGNTSTCVSQVTVGGTILVASASATTILCFGGTADVTVTATGGALPYSGTGTFTVSAGTYTYTVTDAQSCSSDVTIVVDQPDQIEANITPQNHVIDCIPIPVDLTANPTGGTGGPYTYLWSTGETTASIEVNPNVTTTYTVEIWDANGCTVNTATNGTTVTVLNRCGNNNQKVVICHVPPGNSGNPQTICISPNALNPHLSDLWNLHGGDYCGPCQTSSSMIASDNIDKGDNMFIRAGINMNDETVDLSYRIGYDSPVRLEIYDMAGTLVEVVHESHANEGELYEFKLNTTKISSGVYIYQFITNNEKHIDKLQIIQ